MYINKKEGHIEEAIWKNKTGGSEKNYNKKEWRLASISTLLPNNSKRIKLKNTSIANNVSNVHIDALHTTSPLIADTAAIDHFAEMNANFLKNVKLSIHQYLFSILVVPQFAPLILLSLLLMIVLLVSEYTFSRL